MRKQRFNELRRIERISAFNGNESGMEINPRDEQSSNMPFPIACNREFRSNVNVCRQVQDAKQVIPMISTDDGMQIDFSDEHDQNAPRSISRSREFASNVTFSRAVHDLKQNEQTISTHDGMQIDFSDEQ
jgi:hypothetical protein